MSIELHVQFMSPEGKHDRMYGVAKSVVHNGVLAIVRDAAGSDVRVSAGFNNQSIYYATRQFMSAYNNIGILEALFQAQEKGADVALIACGNDPALLMAREALDIPVVGITESAMLLACALGKRFAAVGVERDCADIVESNLEAYGLVDKAIRRDPVRTADLAESLIPWFENPEYVRSHVIPRFEEAALGAIEDGAEVIVTSCAGFACLTANGYFKVTGTDVPVIEGTLAGAHLARVYGSLRKLHGLSTSKQRTFKGLPAATVAQCLGPLRAQLAGG
jgi:Asp/Glu/hydantoin racemase